MRIASISLLIFSILIILLTSACNKIEQPAIPRTDFSTLTPSANSIISTEQPQETAVTLQPATDNISYGGNLEVVLSINPDYLSGPYVDAASLEATFPGVEKLMDISSTGDGLEPVLCESVYNDSQNKCIVFKLVPGITFHDGSLLTADVVIWNINRLKEAKALICSEYLNTTNKIDDYTYKMEYSEYVDNLIGAWGYIPIYSQAAYENASGGDVNAGTRWESQNVVGTGPFKLMDYRKNNYFIWLKYTDYWREKKPYLNRINVDIRYDQGFIASDVHISKQDIWYAHGVYDNQYVFELFNDSGRLGDWPDAILFSPHVKHHIIYKNGLVRWNAEDIWLDDSAPKSRFAVNLLAPDEEERLKTVTPVLVWQPYVNALSYDLEIFQYLKGEKISCFAQKGITENQITIPEGYLTWDKTYYWKVKAHLQDNSTIVSEQNSINISTEDLPDLVAGRIYRSDDNIVLEVSNIGELPVGEFYVMFAIEKTISFRPPKLYSKGWFVDEEIGIYETMTFQIPITEIMEDTDWWDPELETSGQANYNYTLLVMPVGGIKEHDIENNKDISYRLFTH